jgi:hypothetical protein
MLFGLVNAPSTFKRSVDVILSSVKWKLCLVYLDDTIIYSPSFEIHVDDLDFVLGLLESAGVSLRLRKCNFFQNKDQVFGTYCASSKITN